jgi:hypothetical protein
MGEKKHGQWKRKGERVMEKEKVSARLEAKSVEVHLWLTNPFPRTIPRVNNITCRTSWTGMHSSRLRFMRNKYERASQLQGRNHERRLHLHLPTFFRPCLFRSTNSKKRGIDPSCFLLSSAPPPILSTVNSGPNPMDIPLNIESTQPQVRRRDCR